MTCPSSCICSGLGMWGHLKAVVSFMMNINPCGQGNQGGVISSADWHSDSESCLYSWRYWSS